MKMVKMCRECKQAKPLDEFHKEAHNKGGYRHVCKICRNAAHKKYHYENTAYRKRQLKAGRSEQSRLRCRAYINSVSGRAKMRKTQQRYYQQNPIKTKARIAFKRAVRLGAIVRQPCEVCGKLKTDGHHDDYTKPFDVRWLCRLHHMEHHRKIFEVNMSISEVRL